MVAISAAAAPAPALACATDQQQQQQQEAAAKRPKLEQPQHTIGTAIPPSMPVMRKPIDIPAAWHWFRTVLQSPRYIAAPMVNQSELPFRQLCRKYDVNLCYTPMLHAGQFCKSSTYRATELTSCSTDRPLIVQFCGNDPATLLQAAKYIDGTSSDNINNKQLEADGICAAQAIPIADAVDLNLGCPQGIARKGRYGAWMMHETETIRAVIETLYQNLQIPVTAKIRVFDDVKATLRLAHMLQDAGCSLLTVHGRTKEQNKERMGSVDLDIIKLVKSELQIPVIANGGICTKADADRILAYTGCDGVMSSEGLLSNPALFSGKHPESLQLASEYLELCQQYAGADGSAQRSHLFKILHQHLQSNPDLRCKLGNCPPTEFTKIVDELRQRNNVVHAADGSEDHWYHRYQIIAARHAKKKQEMLAQAAVNAPTPSQADSKQVGADPALNTAMDNTTIAAQQVADLHRQPQQHATMQHA